MWFLDLSAEEIGLIGKVSHLLDSTGCGIRLPVA